MDNKHRILITGTNGLLGQKLVSLFSSKNNIQFLGTSRGENRIEGVFDFKFREMDICNADQVKNVCEDFKPTCIINTAAFTQVDDCEVEPEKCHELNVAGVSNLIDASIHHKAKLIHLSTDFIFDGEKGHYSEEDVPNPLSVYAQSKLDSEVLLQNSDLEDWVIIRTIIVYGVTHKMSRSNLVLWSVKALSSGQEITVVDDQFRAPTLAEDLAEACWLVAQKDAKGIFHISGPETFSIIELVQQVALSFSLDEKLISPISSETLNQKAKRPPKTGFDISKAKKELGYKPHTFMEGLEVVKKQMKLSAEV